VNVVIPRPPHDGEPAAGVGKVYIFNFFYQLKLRAQILFTSPPFSMPVWCICGIKIVVDVRICQKLVLKINIT